MGLRADGERISALITIFALSGWIGMVLLDFAADYCMGRVKSTLQEKDKTGGN